MTKHHDQKYAPVVVLAQSSVEPNAGQRAAEQGRRGPQQQPHDGCAGHGLMQVQQVYQRDQGAEQDDQRHQGRHGQDQREQWHRNQGRAEAGKPLSQAGEGNDCNNDGELVGDGHVGLVQAGRSPGG
jgi:hypothetical protein